MSDDEFDKMMNEILGRIMEHADAVRIFVSQHDDDQTRSYTIGRGNFHAQYGLVKEWMARQDQHNREKAKQDAREDDL